MVVPIAIDEIPSPDAFDRARPEMRRRYVAARKQRRVSLGEHLALVFEGRDTVLFQMLETIRAEGITDRAALAAECEVYNALLPSRDELAMTMSLVPTRNLSGHDARAELTQVASQTYLVVDAARIRGRPEEGPVPTEETPWVLHVRFRLSETERARICDERVQVTLAADHPNYRAEALVPSHTRRLLIEDLS